jgi:D-threo-aldose 1-dehydrogenase
MTELTLGRLGFGAANLGNLYREVSDDEVTSVLDAAWEQGIRYFDTAPHYGAGLSERRLGAFLQTKPRDEFVISTKVGRLLRPNPPGADRDLDRHGFEVSLDLKRVWDPSPSGVRASLNESLERLGLDRVDILYLHDPDQYDLSAGISVGIPALVELRNEGLVSEVGIGSMNTEALLAAARTGLVDVLMVAGRYTLASQPVIPQVIDACEEHGVGIVNASIFNSGLLAKARPAPNARFDYAPVAPELLARVNEIADLCQEFGVELPAVALQFSLRDPLVRNVVIGTSRVSQLFENVERMNADIADALWERLIAGGYIRR